MFPGCERGCEAGWLGLHKAPVPAGIPREELSGWALEYQDRCAILGEPCRVRRCACDGVEDAYPDWLETVEDGPACA
jgi:hypothetical protein